MRLFRAAHANLARDGMHVHASATAAHVGPKRMLALFLDDDRMSVRISPETASAERWKFAEAGTLSCTVPDAVFSSQ